MPELKNRLYLYTFGAPRLGNKQFANYTNQLLNVKHIFRVVYKKDPIPLLPAYKWGYCHVGDGPYHFRDTKHFSKKRTPDDKKSGLSTLFHIKDHVQYKKIQDA